MMTSSNSEQIEFWNGRAGERWATFQESLDRALSVFGRAAQRRLAPLPNEQVLDIGCGAGQTSLELADAVGPLGRVVGVDVSEPLLAVARARAAAHRNIEFIRADASEFQRARRFDACFSRFGVMFFADPTGAFRHLHSLLTPGGRFTFVSWRALAENPWLQLPAQALSAFEPTDQPPPALDAPGPFAFADTTRLSEHLSAAQFKNISIEPFSAEIVLSESGLDEAVEFATRVGPAARWLADLEPAAREHAKLGLRAALSPHSAGTRVTLKGSANVVSGFAS